MSLLSPEALGAASRSTGAIENGASAPPRLRPAETRHPSPRRSRRRAHPCRAGSRTRLQAHSATPGWRISHKPPWPDRERDAGDDLALLQSRAEKAREEGIRRNLALVGDDRRAERQHGGGVSAAGSLLATEPPIVPRWRTWGSPMPAARSARPESPCGRYRCSRHRHGGSSRR